MYLQKYRLRPICGLSQPGAQCHGLSLRRVPFSLVPEWNLDLPDWFEQRTESNSTNLLTSSLRTTIDTELPGGAPGCGDPAPPGIPTVMSVSDVALPIHQPVKPTTEPLSYTW